MAHLEILSSVWDPALSDQYLVADTISCALKETIFAYRRVVISLLDGLLPLFAYWSQCGKGVCGESTLKTGPSIASWVLQS